MFKLFPLLCLLFIVSPSPAKAAYVFDSDRIDTVIGIPFLATSTGILKIGDSEKFDITNTTVQWGNSYSFQGLLPSNSMINMTYQARGYDPTFVQLHTQATTYDGLEASASEMHYYESHPPTQRSNSALLLASAQINPLNGAKATIQIINKSSGVAEFLATYYSDPISSGLGMFMSYEVSAVPLPPALALFMFGIVFLSTFHKRLKNKSV